MVSPKPVISKLSDFSFATQWKIHIEGEIARAYSYKDIISNFQDLKKRRVDF